MFIRRIGRNGCLLNSSSSPGPESRSHFGLILSVGTCSSFLFISSAYMAAGGTQRSSRSRSSCLAYPCTCPSELRASAGIYGFILVTEFGGILHAVKTAEWIFDWWERKRASLRAERCAPGVTGARLASRVIPGAALRQGLEGLLQWHNDIEMLFWIFGEWWAKIWQQGKVLQQKHYACIWTALLVCHSFHLQGFFCSVYWLEFFFWELCIQEDILQNLQRHPM